MYSQNVLLKVVFTIPTVITVQIHCLSFYMGFFFSPLQEIIFLSLITLRIYEVKLSHIKCINNKKNRL